MKKKMLVVLVFILAAYVTLAGVFLQHHSTLELVRCGVRSQVAYIPSQLCRVYLYDIRNKETDIEQLKRHGGIKYILGVASQVNADYQKRNEQATTDKNAKALLHYYLGKGLDINQVGHDDGMTALQREAIMNKPVWVKYLVDHGADLTIRDKHHQLTALEYAILLQQDNPRIAREKVIGILKAHTKVAK